MGNFKKRHLAWIQGERFANIQKLHSFFTTKKNQRISYFDVQNSFSFYLSVLFNSREFRYTSIQFYFKLFFNLQLGRICNIPLINEVVGFFLCFWVKISKYWTNRFLYFREASHRSWVCYIGYFICRDQYCDGLRQL